MKVLIFIIIAYGITSIVVTGSLFYNLIEKTKGLLHDLLTCPLCFSPWVGFVMGTMLLVCGIKSPIYEYYDLPNYLDVFACGMLSAGGVWLIENYKK